MLCGEHLTVTLSPSLSTLSLADGEPERERERQTHDSTSGSVKKLSDATQGGWGGGGAEGGGDSGGRVKRLLSSWRRARALSARARLSLAPTF